MSELSDESLLRYSRHILLNEIDVAGVEKIRAARVVIVGVGGLGSVAALYLAASGVGHLTLVDEDQVDLTNLQRQVAFSMEDLAVNKAKACARRIATLNPEVVVKVMESRLDSDKAMALLSGMDVILDCSDNFATRHLLNRCAYQLKIPLVSGAAIRFDGQLTVFDMRHSDSPCYECLFPDNGAASQEACATMGVLSPLVGMIGSGQALETLKLLVGMGSQLVGRLFLFNALSFECSQIKYRPDPNCPICGTH